MHSSHSVMVAAVCGSTLQHRGRTWPDTRRTCSQLGCR
jgi:hypothetical protein